MLTVKPKGKHSWDNTLIILSILVVIKLFIHLFTNIFAGYGIFRDELYYLACTNRLDLGFVDHPPLSIYLLKVSSLLFGRSLFPLRILPAIAGALTVLFTGLTVKKMGGRGLAVSIAGLSIISAPILLAMNTFYSMNCIDILLWSIAAYLVLVVFQEKSPRFWIILGVVLGLGLLNKISMAWFGAGLALVLLVTKNRKNLVTPWPYITALIAFLIFSPFIIWNMTNDFAHLEFIRNATQFKYSSISPVDFLLGQLLLFHPFTIPIWLAGLFFYFFNKKAIEFRPLGIIFITVLLILLVNGRSKPEYMAAAFPIVFAAGGAQWERWIVHKKWIWLKYGLPGLLVMGGILTAPLALPILPVETFISYSRAIGMGQGNYESKELAALPQFYADMFGWEKMARTVSEVYASLPPGEKEHTVVFAGNYGEAGAIEYFSTKYPLPPVVSPHNNYWIWWGREHRGKEVKTVIIIGGKQEEHLRSLEKVEPVALFKCTYCMPYENNKTIFVGRDLRRSLEELWKELKQFN